MNCRECWEEESLRIIELVIYECRIFITSWRHPDSELHVASTFSTLTATIAVNSEVYFPQILEVYLMALLCG